MKLHNRIYSTRMIQLRWKLKQQRREIDAELKASKMDIILLNLINTTEIKKINWPN